MVHRKHIDIEELRLLSQKGLTVSELSVKFKVSEDLIRMRLKEYNIPTNKKYRKFTEQEKKLFSKKRKEWLVNNPDKHPWKRLDKYKSKPCEKIKELLKAHDVEFIEEYNPNIFNRFFSIDIALPDKKIAIEINGNQHYENNGSLKTYYQERHDLLEKYGWIVFEIHYSNCFVTNIWTNFISDLKQSEIKQDFNYFEYRFQISSVVKKTFKRTKKIKEKQQKQPPKVYICDSCGNPKKSKISKACQSCHSLSKRKTKRPTKEELDSLLENNSYSSIGRRFNVSDNTIRKWCKYYNKCFC